MGALHLPILSDLVGKSIFNKFRSLRASHTYATNDKSEATRQKARDKRQPLARTLKRHRGKYSVHSIF